MRYSLLSELQGDSGVAMLIRLLFEMLDRDIRATGLICKTVCCPGLNAAEGPKRSKVRNIFGKEDYDQVLCA